MKIRIIGDVHQQYQDYFEATKDCDGSIQIGDMGFDYSPLDKIDPIKHCFFGGNHESYDKLYDLEHNIGNYGRIFNNKIFFVRGAWSIDQKYRTPELDWFSEEELSEKNLELATICYLENKPEIMLTHESPFNLLQYLDLNPRFAKSYGFEDSLIKTRTNQALQNMLDNHKPKLWIYGHYHKDFDKTIDGTRFICLCCDKRFKCKQYFDIEV